VKGGGRVHAVLNAPRGTSLTANVSRNDLRKSAEVNVPAGNATGLAALITVVFLASCSDREITRSAFHVRDSAGISISESTRPAWQDGAWKVTEESILLIGSAESEELIRPRDAVRLDDGRLVVTDEGSRQVKFFAPDGRLVHVLGRQGRGPGEFGTLWTVRPFRRDSLMVFDYNQERVSILDLQGNFGRSFAVAFGPNYWAQGVLLDSMIFLASPGEGRRQNDITGIYWDSTWFVMYRGPDLPVDTIGRYPLGEQPGMGRGRRRAYHFGHRLQFALARDRIYMGWSQAYEIGEYTADGKLLRLIRRAYQPQPVTDEVKAQFRQDYEALVRAEEGDRVTPEQMTRYLAFVDDADYPVSLPAYSALRVDPDGNLWAEDYRIYTQSESRWTVFDPAGRWLGTVQMPNALQVLEIGRDYVLGLRKDAMGVERVSLHALVKASGAT
jgi:hypothetical protein